MVPIAPSKRCGRASWRRAGKEGMSTPGSGGAWKGLVEGGGIGIRIRIRIRIRARARARQLVVPVCFAFPDEPRAGSVERRDHLREHGANAVEQRAAASKLGLVCKIELAHDVQYGGALEGRPTRHAVEPPLLRLRVLARSLGDVQHD